MGALSRLLTAFMCVCDWQCFILPKQRESIGNAERPGGLKSYCTKPISGQGSLPGNMFTKGPFIKTGRGRGNWKQITGCFNPNRIATLQPNDDGGCVEWEGSMCAEAARLIPLFPTAKWTATVAPVGVGTRPIRRAQGVSRPRWPRAVLLPIADWPSRRRRLRLAD